MNRIFVNISLLIIMSMMIGAASAIGQPSGVVATVMDQTRINISWQPPTGDTIIAGYTIYRSTDNIVFYGIAATLNTFYIDAGYYGNEGLIPGTRYYYYIVARDEAWNPSIPSETVSAMIIPIHTPTPTPIVTPTPTPIVTPTPTPIVTPTPTPIVTPTPTPIVTPTPTPIVTPTPTPIVTPTPTPISEMKIISTNMGGSIFTAPTEGTYKITIIGGAFTHSIYWNPILWTGSFGLYINKPVEWGGADQWGIHPINWDVTIGNGGEYITYNEAETASLYKFTLVHLNEGEYIIGIIEDGSDYYSDNSGTITASVEKVSCGNTITGQNIETVPISNLRVKFYSVQSCGETSVTIYNDNQWGPIPSDYSAIKFYDIMTTATYDNSITIQLTYLDSDIPSGIEEIDLKLLHYNNGNWIDITTSLDTTSNTITGIVDSLSPFVIAGSPSVAPSPTVSPMTTPISGNIVRGSSFDIVGIMILSACLVIISLSRLIIKRK